MPAAKETKKSSPSIRGLLLIQRKRAKKIERSQMAPFINPPGETADDFVCLSVDADHAAYDVTSRSEALLPATLTQDDHMVVSRDVFSRKKIAAELRLHAEHRQQVRGDPQGANYLGGLARLRQARIAKGISADIAIGLPLATKVKIGATRDRALWILWRYPTQSLELFALRI